MKKGKILHLKYSSLDNCSQTTKNNVKSISNLFDDKSVLFADGTLKMTDHVNPVDSKLQFMPLFI